MKRIYLLLFLTILVSNFIYAAGNLPNTSPATKMLVKELESGKFHDIEELKKTCAVLPFKSNQITGMVKMREPVQIEIPTLRLTQITDNIYTFGISLEFFLPFTHLAGIEYIQIDEKINFKLDKVTTLTNSNLVNSGQSLPRAYSGKDVIVGIIDFGFDYTNPFFYTVDNQPRILSVWDQNSANNPPSGYSYGTELIGNSIISKAYDIDNYSHGTHVAGIAAGSVMSETQGYNGMAPESNLIFVSLLYDEANEYTTTQSTIIDAISYIFKKADAAGKPAVINMSLGNHVGPHDGTSLFDEACDALVGQGKILVGAAGNEGGDKLHIDYNFTTENNQFVSFVEFYDPEQKTVIDSWGQSGRDYCLAIALFNLNLGDIASSTEFWCASEDAVFEEEIDGYEGGTCKVTFVTTQSEFNGKTRVYVYIENNTNDLVVLAANANGSTGRIDIWNSYGQFENIGQNWAVDGNINCTVGEIGGTGKSIISVGSYVSKNSYKNIFNQTIGVSGNYQNGQLADYSSRGNTVDGRVKPDITAPGSAIVSSVSYYDNEYKQSGNSSESLVLQFDKAGKKRYFAAEEGTSMASPAVAGIIALLLEADPGLTPTEIKTVLKATAIKDSFTGNIGQAGNSNWGWGKINAMDAIKYVLNISSVKEQKPDMEFVAAPNPSYGNISIFNLGSSIIEKVDIYNILGVKVKSINSISDNKLVEIENLLPGTYIINTITSSGKSFRLKQIVLD